MGSISFLKALTQGPHRLSRGGPNRRPQIGINLTISSSTLAPTDQTASHLISRLRLMPIGTQSEAPSMASMPMRAGTGEHVDRRAELLPEGGTPRRAWQPQGLPLHFSLEQLSGLTTFQQNESRWPAV